MKSQKKPASPGYRLYELLSSMRFAIGLLTILSIASVIGTVLKQNEAYPNYAFEFGQFWFKAFEYLGLYDVYHSAWFLTILAFLVISTTLCIVRNGPVFLRDMKGFREKAAEGSLKAMKHSRELAVSLDEAQAVALILQRGMRYKRSERDDGSIVLAAKKGSGSKLGYFFAHIAMVVICIGGLMDGNLPLKIGELTGSIVPETRELPQGQIPPQSRLGANNLSFRGSVNRGGKQKRRRDLSEQRQGLPGTGAALYRDAEKIPCGLLQTTACPSCLPAILW